MPDYDFYLRSNMPAGEVIGSELVSNTDFETNITGWISDSRLVVGSLSQSAAQAHSGTKSLLMTWPTGGPSTARTTVTTVIGKTYEFSAWVYVPTDSPSPYLDILFHSVGPGSIVKDQWTLLTHRFVADSTSHDCGVSTLSPTSGQICYIDEVSVKEVDGLELGFNTYITKDTPFERATAQFKKDQLDSTATVGDQSLTGWWTRGQLSFHKGAGVKYYEVLGGSDNTVENRYHDSVGAYPWESGEVSLADGFTSVAKTTIVDMVRYEDSGVLALLSSGALWKQAAGAGSTVTPFFTANPITSITQTQGVVFATDGTDIGLVRPGRPSFAQAAATRTWDSIWSLKDRIFAVDDSGRWHTFTDYAAAAAPVSDADTFWNAGVLENPAAWSAAESPAAVYMSRANRIYSISLDTDGLVPTVTFAGMAAQLPDGEVIATIEYYLGWLLIGTNKGVRAALVGADGALVLGPRFLRGDFSARACIATTGDCAYVTGVADGDMDASMFEVNLTEPVTEVIPAWVRRLDDLSPSGPTGAMEGDDGRLYAFDSAGFRYDNQALATSGSLTTGFHRFGTLDSKAFRFLRVKTEGTEGDIEVAANTPDGTTYVVGTVAAGDVEEFDLSTIGGFPDTLEYLSITFTLNRGATTGPTLLGYQLKALPVPKRQRMIRVPLMLFDSEQNRQGQTIAGDPWERLAALEALEESNAVVTFDDRETGETGSAYIESVEVTRTAPAQSGKRGFGGTIFVTLRRL